MEGEVLISVVMPVFNGETYLVKALESIINQSYPHWELIAVDDGSSDGSLSILQEYAARDARIKVIKNEKNVGLPAALNVGLKKASGEFIARQDADDISESDRFQKQIDFLIKHPAIGLVGCNGYFMDDQGNSQNDCNVPTKHDLIVKAVLNRGLPFLHGSWMFRRVSMNHVGLYNEYMFACEDKDFVLRVSEQFQIANLPDNLYHYRIHAGGFTSTSINMRKLFRKVMLDAYQDRQNGSADVFGGQCGLLFNTEKIDTRVNLALQKMKNANQQVSNLSFVLCIPSLLIAGLQTNRPFYLSKLVAFLVKVNFTILLGGLTKRVARFL